MKVRPAAIAGLLGGGLLSLAPALEAQEAEAPAPDSVGAERIDAGARIEPVELPALEARVRWHPDQADRTRSVFAVSFDEAPISWRNIGEWLSTGPGVSMRGSAATGGEAFSVRGSRPEGVLVLLDGHPVNDPVTGRADLSTVAVGSIESATLVKGASSARYGSGALSGVLLLQSRHGGESGFAGEIGVSSFGGFGGRARASWSGSAGMADLSASWNEARNDFEYENRLLPGEPVETRVNTDASRLSVSGSASKGRWRLGLRYDGLERGSPGPMGNHLFDTARWSDRRALATLDWQGKSGGISGSVGWSGTDWDPGSGAPGSHREALVVGVGADGRSGGALDLELAGRMSVESLRGDDLATGVGRVLLGGSIGRALRPGAVEIRPAVSLDGTAGSWALSPEVGARAPVGSGLALRARVGQAFRLPTLADLYLSPALRVRSNPDLEAERVRLDAELGLAGEWSAGEIGIRAELAGWFRQIEDPIVWLASSVALWSPHNLDRLESTGLESSLQLTMNTSATSGWTISAAGTLDRSRLGFGANRNPLPYRPSTVASLGMEAWGRSVSARVLWRWTGSRTTSVAGTRSLPGFATFDLAVAWRIPVVSLPLEVEARADNLLDRCYELVELYPEPGRRFSLMLRYR